MPQRLVDEFVDYITQSGAVEFPGFYRHIWKFSDFGGRLQMTQPPGGATWEQKAKAVFDRIDLDASGSISPFELQSCLFAWGLPRRDVSEYLQKYGRGGRTIDFQEFRDAMGPIWKFAYFDVIARPLRERAWFMSG